VVGVGVCVGVAVRVVVVVGVGVGVGSEGQLKDASQAVPTSGAVITTVTTDGVWAVLLKVAVPLPGPETFGYPKAFKAELYEDEPLNPVSITVVLFQKTSNLSGTEYASKVKVKLPVPFPTSIVTVNIPLPPDPAHAEDCISVLQVVAEVYCANGVAVGVCVGVLVGVVVNVGVCDGVAVRVVVVVGVCVGVCVGVASGVRVWVGCGVGVGQDV